MYVKWIWTIKIKRPKKVDMEGLMVQNEKLERGEEIF